VNVSKFSVFGVIHLLGTSVVDEKNKKPRKRQENGLMLNLI